MKLTAGVLSTAVLAGMFATGIPTKIAAATEHWNDASRESTDYNPRSVVSCMRFGKIGNYWNHTETFDALQIYIDMNFEGLKDDVLSMIAGESVPVNTVLPASSLNSSIAVLPRI